MRKVCIGLMVILFSLGMFSVSAVRAQDATPQASPVADLPSEDELPAFEGTVENGIRTIVVVEEAVSDVVIDLAPVGDSAGDLLVFANPVFDETMQTMVGTDQGYCVRASPQIGVWECTWTLILANGQLVVQGPFYDARESTLAITGGTGAYTGARGEMALSVVSETDIKFTYRIIEE